MPRKQKIKVNTGGTGVLDAFAVTRDEVPIVFQEKPVIIAPQNDVHGQHQKDDESTKVYSERYAPKPKTGKTKASEQPPVVKRMGRRKTGRNIQIKIPAASGRGIHCAKT